MASAPLRARPPAAAFYAAAGVARADEPRISGPLRLRRAVLAAAALFAAAAVPVACGERREQARLAALEAGIASAQASLSALSAAAPSGPPFSGGAPSFRPVGAAPAPAAAALPSAGPLPPPAASGLLGAGPDALRRWFGEPDLRRPEGGAEVRLYLGPGCALDVVLYAEAAGGGGAPRVAHAVARAEGAAAVTEAECLRGIGGGAGRAAPAGHSGRR